MTPGPRVDTVFLGTARFAVPVLEALAGSAYRPSLVLTRLDSRSGRGLRESGTPVALAAAALGLPVVRIASAGDPPALPGCPVLAVSAAFGLWLPAKFVAMFPMGVLNVHPSLLPRHRGPCPVERAILGGDPETGVSFMLTDSGWDTGPVVRSIPTAISPTEDSGELSARLSELAARELAGVISGYLEGSLIPAAQSGEATHAAKLTEGEAVLDWSLPAAGISRTVRAFAPSPGASTRFRGRLLKILSVGVCDRPLAPGSLLCENGHLYAGCGDSSVEILRLQPESRKAMDGAAFLAGYRPLPGESLG